MQGDAKDLAGSVRDAAKNIKDPQQKQKALKAASDLEEAANKVNYSFFPSLLVLVTEDFSRLIRNITQPNQLSPLLVIQRQRLHWMMATLK